MLRFAAVEVGAGEALGCVRCSPRGAPAYYPLDDIIDRIAAASGAWERLPGPNVVLCGPEPFAHPELPALVAGCAERGVERICIETDGGALAVGGNAEGALLGGVRHLRVRMLGAGQRATDELSGRPGLSQKAKAGVRAFLDTADARGMTVAVTGVIPVCRHNLDVLPESVGALAEWGVHAARLVSSGPLPESAAAHLAAACDTGMLNRIWVETDGTLPLAASHLLHAVCEAGGDG